MHLQIEKGKVARVLSSQASLQMTHWSMLKSTANHRYPLLSHFIKQLFDISKLTLGASDLSEAPLSQHSLKLALPV